MFRQESTNQGEMTLLKAGQVAQRLNISRSLAYQLMSRGEIPTVRINHSVRVRGRDIEEFIMKQWTGWKDGQPDNG